MNSENSATEFHRRGFYVTSLGGGKAKKKFDAWLKSIDNTVLSDHKAFTQLYQNTFDLRKTASDEFKLVKDFVLEEDFKAKILNITAHKYFLHDVTLRKTYSTKKSYMSMHRDSYFDRRGNQVGRFPPLIKIIYYPHTSLSETPESCLLIKPGSHRQVWQNFVVDKIVSLTRKNVSIESNNETAVIFDSSIYHHACTTAKTNGAFRLILNFCVESQLSNDRNSAEFRKFISSKK